MHTITVTHWRSLWASSAMVAVGRISC